MRYRKKSKIKRKHHLVDELNQFLSVVEQWSEVDAINPGIIKPCNHNDHLKFEVKFGTPSGLKCLAKSHGAVQEVYIVTSDQEGLKSKITDLIV